MHLRLTRTCNTTLLHMCLLCIFLILTSATKKQTALFRNDLSGAVFEDMSEVYVPFNRMCVPTV